MQARRGWSEKLACRKALGYEGGLALFEKLACRKLDILQMFMPLVRLVFLLPLAKYTLPFDWFPFPSHTQDFLRK